LADGLDFVYLNRERYDLVMSSDTAALPVFQALFAWLASKEGKLFVEQLHGYESQESGLVQVADKTK